jgi:hypothetical protein
LTPQSEAAIVPPEISLFFSEVDMELGELNTAIIKWAEDRQILKHSTAYAQAIKTAEEVYELIQETTRLHRSDYDMDDMMDNYEFCQDVGDQLDAIGDIWVTLVVGASCYALGTGDDYQPWVTVMPSEVKNPTEALQKALIPLGASSKGQGSYWMTHNLMVSYLAQIVDSLGVTLTDCVEQAYNEIKDRKGYLNAQGIFVKEQA